MAQIHRHGGVTIVQDPEEAVISSMPLSALRTVEIQHMVRVAQMPELLTRLVSQPGGIPMSENAEPEEDVTESPRLGVDPHEGSGPISPYTCPQCGGAMWDTSDSGVTRFRCHVGHGFTAETLVQMQGDGTETALWTALRILEQNADLSRRMSDKSARGQLHGLADIYRERATQAEAHAEQIRRLLMRGEGRPSAAAEPELRVQAGGSAPQG
jgi:two-component system chemotaxis response regulator CheB